VRKLLLDVDTGIDDALALVYLLAHPEAEILAITCTAGNVPARQVAQNNLALLELCGRSGIEVAIGSEVPLQVPLQTTEDTHGPQGLGYAVLPAPRQQVSPRHAVEVWVETARAHPGEITGLVTGPLTNLALALEAEPRLPELLQGLVIMGGAFNYPGNTTPTAEWNTYVDPHAAKAVYRAYLGVPEDRLPIVCALETTERIEMKPEHLRRLAEAAGTAPELLNPADPAGQRSTSANPLVACLSDAVRFYMEFHRAQNQGFLAHLHDPFAATVAMGEGTWETQLATVDVEADSPLLAGTTIADFRGMWGKRPNARIITGNDPEACFAALIQRIGGLARSIGAPAQ
jgi:purine nucleosidase